MSCYDEAALLAENAEEVGLPFSGPPALRRVDLEVDRGRRVSALVWGDAEPELVLVHGGGQNAHTWDTVLLALGRPAVAVDLPGHGHSDWREDIDYRPTTMAPDLVAVIERFAPTARMLVGMSLGGLTSIVAAARRPDLVPRLALVDITPGTDRRKGSAIAAFLAGPESFASFEEILERTIRFNPNRSVSSLRRGVIHNARQRADGRWVWRHHLGQLGEREAEQARRQGEPDFSTLWEDVSRLSMPVLLIRGADSPVVGDEDVAELRRRLPGVRVEVVAGSGHSVQGDRPLELARLLEGFLSEAA